MIITRNIEHLYRWLRFRHGFGVHSPYAFSFINNVIEEKYQYYGYEDIINKISHVKIRPEFTREYSLKYYQLLFRISHFFKPDRIIIVGHQSGECMLYLKSTLVDVPCVLIDTCRKKVEATQALVENELNISILETDLSNLLKTLERKIKESNQVDIFYFHHSIVLETKQKAIECCLERKPQKPVLFIIDYIGANAEAKECWNWLKEKQEVSITFDLMRLGIAIYYPKLKKQDYRLSF